MKIWRFIFILLVSHPLYGTDTINTPTSPEIHPYLMQENYRFPARSGNRNVDLNVDGFYEIKMSGRNFTPKDINDPRWETIINDPIYNKIPKDVLLGDIKTEHRSKIQIDGKLNDDLSVHFDIEQEPDFPLKSEVIITHKRKSIKFSQDYNAKFNNGTFVHTNKSLNGMHYSQENDTWRTQLAMGKQRSDPKKFESAGNGNATYSFANAFILGGSVDVWLNNTELSEGSDYTIDYTQGSITFLNTLPQKNEYIKVIYEFTNPIADFIPVLSRKNFTGIDFHYKSKNQVTTEKQKSTIVTTLWSEKIAKETISTQNQTQIKPTENMTETIAATLKSLFEIVPSLNPTAQSPTVPITGSLTPPTIPSSDTTIKHSPWYKKVTIPHIFYLKNHPIILGSDKLYLNSTQLKPQVDYFIDHSTGKLSLQVPLSPTDNIDIHYDYYHTHHIIEEKIGKNSAGPYPLQHHNILNRSATVKLDNYLLRDTIDYIIDYDDGHIFFNYTIPFPSIITVQYDAIETKQVTRNVQKKPYEFGLTYMTESTRSPEEELTLPVTAEPITVSNNIITTRFNPLVSTKDITIINTLTNLPIPSNNYTIENAYKGQIKIHDNSITAIKINYKYRKSFRTKFLFRVETPRTIFTTDDPDFNIRTLPMKFNGIEFIRYFNPATGREETLENGTDFVVTSESGHNIKLIFNVKDNISIAAKLDHIPQVGDQFIIEYHYTPDAALDPGNIEINMFGFTFNTKLNKKWSINGEIAGANNNFSKPQKNHTMNYSGNGQDNFYYSLEHSPLVEDSELVFLNGSLQTKDKDYTINYTRGSIRFRNQTPQKSDKIKVLYNYYDTATLTQKGKDSGVKLATKIGAKFQGETLQTEIAFNHIDRKFLPISPINEKKGTLQLDTHLNWKFNTHDALTVSYSGIREDRGNLGTEDDRYYLRNHRVNSNANIKLFNAIDTNNSFRYTTAVEDPKDPSATGNIHLIDTQTWALNTTVGFGPSNLKTSLKRNFSRSISDYLDKTDLYTKTTDETYIYSLYSYTDTFPLLNKISFSPNYSSGHSKSESKNSAEITFRKRSSHGYTSTITPIPSLVIGSIYSNQNITTKTDVFSASKNINILINRQETVSYKPAHWLSTHYASSLSESESPLLNQAGTTTTQKTYSVNRLAPYGLFVASGISPFNRIIKLTKGSYASFSERFKKSSENNLKKHSDSKNQEFTYTNFEPLPGIKLNSFNYTQSNSTITNILNNTTTSENNSIYNSKRHRYSLSFSPNLPIAKLFSYSHNYTKSNRDCDFFNIVTNFLKKKR